MPGNFRGTKSMGKNGLLPGTLDMLISTVGIYGVISFAVARQTREIGLGLALALSRLAASLAPARRAASLDSTRALRYE